jgi:hypothetical protein
MRPRVEEVCRAFAMELIERVAPAIGPAYHQGTAAMIATMLLIVADEWDRGASRRVEENARLRELFRAAVSCVNDPLLKARLLGLGQTTDGDLRISALEAANSTLRAALIDLQTHVESQSGSEARQVEESIWRELVRSTERRRLSLAQF